MSHFPRIYEYYRRVRWSEITVAIAEREAAAYIAILSVHSFVRRYCVQKAKHINIHLTVTILVLSRKT